ncbi:NADH dehydrogenase subunit L [Seinonella peptonophila]|uniref:NADH dehydrogenase subunit L n=1 Tax=Seinonella peptonophila TaxID=112248 RepID=A0A1M4XSQ5_9BACL|nr:NADH-quinone oxidoreductase subunit L [Seinonella peptonophila]SHE96614.1 NADH dehydrogenase subunit L [Seinonella peptonophila]
MRWITLTILLLPLLSFLLLIGGRKWRSRGLVAGIGVLTSYGAFHLSSYLLMNMIQKKTQVVISMPWLTLSDQVVHLGIKIGALQAVMLVLVSLVSCLVQIYSWGYMRDDERFPVFFAYLGLFTFSMLGLVSSANLLQIYIFWELVGLCSFLLIGYWYYKPEARDAAKKAFIVTRIGDVGFFIAILMIFWKIGSFELDAVSKAVSTGTISGVWVTWIAILILIGAIGKSGQFPLHTWLPDAMEGPTPVSALIHAATMVTAGIYLVAATFPVFLASSYALDIVSYIGGFTAIFAACIALVQTDIKRVLAYSTVSQLGYMMLALGSKGYVEGIFHLVTHGFFKALLFLAAGAVIVSLHHEQDLRKMGGLWKKNRGLAIWFLIGCFALVGLPPFSGFFSKDEILQTVYMDGRIGLFVLALITVFLTAFYVFRLYHLIFAGTSRTEQKNTPVPKVMMVPIAILGLLSTLAGFVQFPKAYFSSFLLQGSKLASLTSEAAPAWIGWVAVLFSLFGVGLATLLYWRGYQPAKPRVGLIGWAHRILEQKFYIDQLYHYVFALPLKGLGYFLIGWDRFVVGGLVRLVGLVPVGLSRIASMLQNGQTQTYALVSLIGFILLVIGVTVGRFFS